MDRSEIAVLLPPEWRALLKDELQKPYVVELMSRVHAAYQQGEVFPPQTHIFRALDMVPPTAVRVVILGQDPYHTPGVADGLAFSSFEGNPIPPSLRNIYKEIESEFGVSAPASPDLTKWAAQGVLLLNTSLTVASGEANAHAGYGWHEFTDAVISSVSRECTNVVFILWGKYAGQKRTLIDTQKHLILESAHPSPLSAHKGFFGNGHFTQANEYLLTHGRNAVVW